MLAGDCGSPTYSSRVQAVVARSAPYDFLSTGGQMINNGPSPFEQAVRFVEMLKATGIEVDFHPIQNAHHNLRPEEYAPWTDDPWEEMGWKALAFFQKHLHR